MDREHDITKLRAIEHYKAQLSEVINNFEIQINATEGTNTSDAIDLQSELNRINKPHSEESQHRLQ